MVFKQTKVKKANKTIIIIVACLLFLFVFFVFKKFNLTNKFFEPNKLKQTILSSGFWAYSIFAILQFLQVTLLPLPSSLTTILGVLIFGPITTFLLSTLAILLGSIFAYFLGKFFGSKVLKFFLGKTNTQKLQNNLKKNYWLFFVMMLLPFFPDDLLCMVAGIISMDFKFFLLTNLITRTIGILSLCFLGNLKILKNPAFPTIFFCFFILIFIVKKVKKHLNSQQKIK